MKRSQDQLIHVAVCDDDSRVCDEVKEILTASDIEGLDITCYQSGERLLTEGRKSGIAINIYLLDIALPGISGIDLAREIRVQDQDALILFITDYEQYVYEVFDVLPFRFIRKPVQTEELRKDMTEAITYLRRENRIFFFSIGHDAYQLYYKDILYFEGDGRKCRIHTKQQKYTFYEKVSALTQRLDGQLFVRTHGSFIVNMEAIKAIRTNELVLMDDTIIPVSRSCHANVSRAHLQFLKRRGGL